jgi:hypothetical protein
MAGKKFGFVIAAKVPGSYQSRSEADQAVPGKAMEELGLKYAGKVDFVRRLWTGAFTAEVTDVFLVECDDALDAHNYMQDLTRLLAKGGDPDRFGLDVKIWAGVNPDA